jgi:hypothetical protein
MQLPNWNHASHDSQKLCQTDISADCNASAALNKQDLINDVSTQQYAGFTDLTLLPIQQTPGQGNVHSTNHLLYQWFIKTVFGIHIVKLNDKC